MQYLARSLSAHFAGGAGLLAKIALNFGDLVNSPDNDWTVDEINDKPAEGAVTFCNEAISNGHEITIFSYRSNFKRMTAIINWLEKYGFDHSITVGSERPEADLYVDDNGFRFTGSFEDLRDFIANPRNLVSWRKRR